MSLAVVVGGRHITGIAEDVSFSWGLHGPAECRVKLREKITGVGFDKFTKVYIHDHRAQTPYEGRLEDPGRSVDSDGHVWDLGAVGESARAADRTAPLIYIDTDLDQWRREATDLAASASVSAGQRPAGTANGLTLQFNPGQPVDSTSGIFMRYRAIAEAGMRVGGISYSVDNGITSASFENRLRALDSADAATQIYADTYNTTAVDRSATIATATPLPAGTVTIELQARRTGAATNVASDDNWCAFYNISIKALRLNLNGTFNNTSADYASGRGVLPHEVVIDVLARLLSSMYDVTAAVIDTTSTYQIDQLAYPDGISVEDLFADLMGMLPDYYWQVMPSPLGGKPQFAWRKWPTTVRYEFTLADGLDLPGNDVEIFNEVHVRWTDSAGKIQTTKRTATVPALDAQGLTRTGYLDLGDDAGSLANAQQAGDHFLDEHSMPPTAGTLTVARPVYDNVLHRFVDPYEIRPGYLGRIRELAGSGASLGATVRDGESVFRVMGMDYTLSTNSARVELDAPPKTNEADIAGLLKKRQRKR